MLKCLKCKNDNGWGRYYGPGGEGIEFIKTRTCTSTVQEVGNCIVLPMTQGGFCDNMNITGNACTGSFDEWKDQESS